MAGDPARVRFGGGMAGERFGWVSQKGFSNPSESVIL